jgi:hypothetical protein
LKYLATAALATWASVSLCVQPSYGNGGKLYGVHWWDYTYGQPVGPGPANGWSTETVLTHSDPWWQAWWFQPLYQQAATEDDAAFITRVDYKWGETVPAPGNPDHAGWPGNVAGVAGALGDWSHVWVVGNEPNLTGEGSGWSNNQISPEGYASIYHAVRSAIKATRPQDEVLIAGPSPGGVIPGVRWMAGNDWLSQTIAAVDAIPGAAIDGFALHAYGDPFSEASAAVSSFHADYTSQLQVIDSHGLHDASVYLTEWNRATGASGNLAANEQVTADFIRGAMADVNSWNQTPGHHNIVAMTWFVNEQGGGGWNQYSLEHWKSQGNPIGHPGDLWTAFMEGSQYPAGVKGTRVPEPSAGLLMVTAAVCGRCRFRVGGSGCKTVTPGALEGE